MPEPLLKDLRKSRIAKDLIREGKENGIKNGVKKGKFEDAKSMLDDGLSIDKVLKYTGLKREEIQKIKIKKPEKI